MKFKNVLLASDFDGTLADCNGKIPESVISAIKYFMSEGGRFTVCTGRIFQGQEYVEYIRHIAIGEMGFSPGIIEHCRDGEVIGKGKIPNV